jgi:5-methylcytosine-specific restriction endonuclease McrA
MASLWQQQNKDKANINKKNCSLKRKKRLPSWLTLEDLKQIEEIYLKAKNMSKQTGLEYHVDHIIPLNGKNVSGLHVPSNLQILLASDNLSKSNKFMI